MKVRVGCVGMMVEDESTGEGSNRRLASVKDEMRAADWDERLNGKAKVGCVKLVSKDEWFGGGTKFRAAAVWDEVDAGGCGRNRTKKREWDALERKLMIKGQAVVTNDGRWK